MLEFLMIMGGSILFWILFMLFLHGWGKDEPRPAPVATQTAITPVAAPIPQNEALKSGPTKKTNAQVAPAKKEHDDPLTRIRARAAEIDFQRIGVATAAERDNLQLIKGIGPFIEEKLNALGIYKFSQLANLTESDREQVNEAIEFFKGRIKRDRWVEQAEQLANV